MLRKTYEHPQRQSEVERKTHNITYNQPYNNPNRSSRPIEPLRSSINDDSISIRLEQIKKKYTDANKPSGPRYSQNTFSSKEKCLNQNRNTVSQIKIKDKSLLDSPQKTITKTKVQVKQKIPFGSIRHKSFEGARNINNMHSNQYPQNILPQGDVLIKIGDDQRLDALEKINNKIKNILQGINTGKKQFDAQTLQIRQANIKNSLKQSNKKSVRFNEQSNESSPQHAIQRYQKRSFYDIKCQPFQYSKKQRSTSVIHTQTVQKTHTKSSVIIQSDKKKLSGKQLDDQILKIQQRIKRSSDERQRLTQMLDKKQYKKQKSNQRKFEYVEKIEKKIDSKFGKFQQKIYSIIHNNTQTSCTYDKPNTSINKYTNNSIENSKVKTQIQISSASPFSFNILPIPCDYDQSSQQIQKLCLALSKQIKLDEELRNARIWLQQLNDSQKWIKVIELLNEYENVNYEKQEVIQIFKQTQDQHNPFFQSNSNESIQWAVSKHLQAQDHWNNQIVHCFDVNKMINQGMKPESLDLQQKGYIQMQDIVRFLNIQTGNFYRTRDVVLIFKRITKNSKLTYNEFIQTVSY